MVICKIHIVILVKISKKSLKNLVVTLREKLLLVMKEQGK